MKIALSPLEKLRAAGKFLGVTLNKRPLTVSIEVTKRCNARCDFCDYWKISDRDEMTDFADVIRRFDPLVVVFTGGNYHQGGVWGRWKDQIVAQQIIPAIR